MNPHLSRLLMYEKTLEFCLTKTIPYYEKIIADSTLKAMGQMALFDEYNQINLNA